MEEMIINSTITIAEDTEMCWSGKIIRLKSEKHIVCKGTLVLEDCIIHSREKGYAGRIFGKGKGNIIAKNCTFVNYRHSESSFFIELEDAGAQFERCTFENCTRYIEFNGTLEMTDCQFVNCLFKTVATRWNSKDAICRFANINIRNDTLSPAIKNALKNVSGRDRSVFVIEARECTIANVEIEEGNEFSEIVLKHKKERFFDGAYIYTNGIIDNLKMKNTTMAVCSTVVVQRSSFEKCVTPLRTYAEHQRYCPLIKNCEFSECAAVIVADHKTKVEDCTFLSCCGNLIKQKQFSDEGEISVDNCRFLHCTNDIKEFHHVFDYLVSSDAAMLFFCGSKISKTSMVRNCLIEGMVLNEGFFVATGTLYKTPGYIVSVSNCRFVDCYTNRNDYEIFKRRVHYYGAFGREKNDPAIQVSDCVGLDEIRNDFVDDFDENEFDEDDFEEYVTADDASIQTHNQATASTKKQNYDKSKNSENNDTANDVAKQLFRTVVSIAKTTKRDN